jgi:GrpB-like predicted nucleotidyltransferase (UPF0157 family)
MIAKPILDVDIEIPREVPVAIITEKLGTLGYAYQGELGIADRHAYRRDSDDVPFVEPRRTWMSQHVYVCPIATAELTRHLHFRDALVASPELRDEYCALKLRCVARAADGQMLSYQAAKDDLGRPFFERVLALDPWPGDSAR